MANRRTRKTTTLTQRGSRLKGYTPIGCTGYDITDAVQRVYPLLKDCSIILVSPEKSDRAGGYCRHMVAVTHFLGKEVKKPLIATDQHKITRQPSCTESYAVALHCLVKEMEFVFQKKWQQAMKRYEKTTLLRDMLESRFLRE